MKYSATSKDFDSKLKSSITKENLFWFLTPKIFNDKPFCGTFDKNSFNLNLNTFISSIKPFKIKGSYKKTKYNYNIQYEIDSTKASKIFSFIIIIIAFVISNLLVYSDTKEILIFPNIILIAIFLFGTLMHVLVKRYLKRKFEKVFNLKNAKQVN
jgi:hypothetical protein